MALFNRQYFSRVTQALRLRARKLPTRGRALLDRPLGRAFLWIGLSLLLAAWAHQSSTQQAWEHWEDTRRPSWQVWDHTLTMQGFKTAIPSLLSDKILKKIPDRFRNFRKIWRSENWFVLTAEDGDHLWVGKSWVPGGLANFDFKPLENSWETLAQVSKEKRQPTAEPAVRPVVAPRDSREIRY